jgi:type IV secretory pathway VirB4 component
VCVFLKFIFQFYIVFLSNPTPIAQIAMESLANRKAIFFLASNSDQRKLVASLEKKAFVEQAWNG